MFNAKSSWSRWSMIGLTAVALAAFGVAARTQELAGASTQKGAYIDDWSHHRLVYSNPGAREDAVKRGALNQWLRTTNDPRYQLQQSKRSIGSLPVTPDSSLVTEPDRLDGLSERPDPSPIRLHRIGRDAIKKDWSTPLGSGTTSTGTCTITVAAAYCVPPGTGVTINGVNITTNGTVPTGGSAVVSANGWGATSGQTTTIGGVIYYWVATLASPCGTTENCVLVSASGGGTQGHDNTAEAFYRALNNGGNCTNTGANSTCYELATGQGANPEVAGVYTANSATVTFTWKCAGTASLYQITSTPLTTNLTITQSTGGGDGTAGTGTFAIPTTVSNSTLATNIETAINTETANDGIKSTVATNVVTLTANAAGTGGNASPTLDGAPTGVTISGSLTGGTSATVQPNAYPAKYGANLTTASCANDFVVYPTGQAGGTGAADIIAYDELYTTGCTGAPTVYWAYHTENGGTGYTVTTSPILSLDGTKVAFIQSNGTNSDLVVLKWKASNGTLGAPIAPTSASNINTCTAPCMTVTALSHNDTYSAPYYDYDADALYVGDDSGYLEKFTTVFNGTAIGGPTAVTLGGSYALASPVYDNASGCVFVGDTEGYLYKVNSGVAGSLCTSGTFGANVASAILGDGSSGQGIFDGVLVDAVAQEVYAFVTASKAITATGTCAALSNCVAEFPTNFTSGAAPGKVEPVGTGAAGYNLYAGAFDNVYQLSASNPPSGNLYVIGNTATAGGATLYRLTITNGLIAGVTSAVTGLNSTEYPFPSPATEFCNNGVNPCTANASQTTGGIDYLFFSVNRGSATVGGTTTGCTNAAGDGCIFSYQITTTTPALTASSALNVTTPGTNGCWATGGMVIDNSATGTTGAQQIYFVNLDGAAAGGALGTPTSAGCTSGAGPTIYAVQASQSAP